MTAPLLQPNDQVNNTITSYTGHSKTLLNTLESNNLHKLEEVVTPILDNDMAPLILYHLYCYCDSKEYTTMSEYIGQLIMIDSNISCLMKQKETHFKEIR